VANFKVTTHTGSQKTTNTSVRPDGIERGTRTRSAPLRQVCQPAGVRTCMACNGGARTRCLSVGSKMASAQVVLLLGLLAGVTAVNDRPIIGESPTYT
jgi:hypothetical protein